MEFTPSSTEDGSRQIKEEMMSFALDVARPSEWTYDVLADETLRSPGFNALYGRAPLSWTLDHFHQSIVADDRGGARAAFSSCLTAGSEIRYDARVNAADGDIRWLRHWGRPLRGQDDRIVAIEGFVADVSQQYKLHSELRKSNAESVMWSEIRTRFLAHMSHEIRTPLAAIQGFTQLMTEIDLPEQGRLFLEVIDRNTQSLARLVDDMLEISKNTGPLVPERRVFDLHETIAGLAKPFETLAAKKGLVFVTVAPFPLPRLVIGDVHRARRVLAILLENAVKFCDRGGVTLKARVQSVGSATTLRFDVVDTGIGVSTADQRSLFQPFCQVDSSTGRRFGGAGLGLALARRLAQSMNGSVTLVESEPFHGSTFCLQMPISRVRNPKTDLLNS